MDKPTYAPQCFGWGHQSHFPKVEEMLLGITESCLIFTVLGVTDTFLHQVNCFKGHVIKNGISFKVQILNTKDK